MDAGDGGGRFKKIAIRGQIIKIKDESGAVQPSEKNSKNY